MVASLAEGLERYALQALAGGLEVRMVVSPAEGLEEQQSLRVLPIGSGSACKDSLKLCAWRRNEGQPCWGFVEAIRC
jgi:hypothetical protein